MMFVQPLDCSKKLFRPSLSRFSASVVATPTVFISFKFFGYLLFCCFGMQLTFMMGVSFQPRTPTSFRFHFSHTPIDPLKVPQRFAGFFFHFIKNLSDSFVLFVRFDPKLIVDSAVPYPLYRVGYGPSKFLRDESD